MDKKIEKILVASVLDTFRIVINKGESDNIEAYMRFLVYEEGDEIMDPITYRSLGRLEIPKGFFKVDHIQENLTILSAEIKKENLSLSEFTKIKFLKDNKFDIEQLSNIRIGDKVKIVNKIMLT